MPNDYTGPTWADVNQMIAEYEKEYRGRIVVRMERAVIGKDAWVVTVDFTRAQRRNDWWIVAYDQERFPNRHSRTLPGLLSRMVLDVCDKVSSYDLAPIVQQSMPVEELPTPRADADY